MQLMRSRWVRLWGAVYVLLAHATSCVEVEPEAVGAVAPQVVETPLPPREAPFRLAGMYAEGGLAWLIPYARLGYIFPFARNRWGRPSGILDVGVGSWVILPYASISPRVVLDRWTMGPEVAFGALDSRFLAGICCTYTPDTPKWENAYVSMRLLWRGSRLPVIAVGIAHCF